MKLRWLTEEMAKEKWICPLSMAAPDVRNCCGSRCAIWVPGKIEVSSIMLDVGRCGLAQPIDEPKEYAAEAISGIAADAGQEDEPVGVVQVPPASRFK